MDNKERWKKFKEGFKEGFEAHKFAYGFLAGEFTMLGIFVVLDSLTKERKDDSNV